MTVEEIVSKTEGKLICSAEIDEDISSVYAGDFLSRVMGNAPPSCVWLTVMTNINVAGVATLADIKAIVLCENVVPDNLLIKKCNEENIALIQTIKTVYECCKVL